jgi:hypothetical protein
MLIRDSEMRAWHAALALAFGILATFAALYLAIHLVGPFVRAWLGVPAGFNEDYSTKEAWRQARGVQILSLIAVFFLIGLALGVAKCPKPFAWSLWTANPFSVGFGYWVFQRLFSSSGPGEYFGYVGLGLLALLSPFVLAPCMLLGTRIGSHFRPADGGGYHHDAPA